MPPFNHFELAELRDRALLELGVGDLTGAPALMVYADEILSSALRGDEDLIEAITVLKDLCIAHEYLPDLMDFYLLYFAYTDLQVADKQWYWSGATRDNILTIIRERARQFVEDAEQNA